MIDADWLTLIKGKDAERFTVVITTVTSQGFMKSLVQRSQQQAACSIVLRWPLMTYEVLLSICRRPSNRKLVAAK